MSLRIGVMNIKQQDIYVMADVTKVKQYIYIYIHLFYRYTLCHGDHSVFHVQ